MKKPKKNLSYRLDSIRVDQFFFDNNIEFDKEIVGFGIKIDNRISVVREESKIELHFGVTFDDGSGKKSKIAFNIDIVYSFFIEDFDNTVPLNEDGTNDVADEFIMLMFNLGIGTTRGILFSKLEGTRYSNVLFPPISPKTLFDNFMNNRKSVQKKSE